jgi:hypothetical protein
MACKPRCGSGTDTVPRYARRWRAREGYPDVGKTCCAPLGFGVEREFDARTGRVHDQMGGGQMIKRLMAAGAVVGVVALTAGSIGPAAGNGGGPRHGGHGDHGERVRVVSTTTEENFLDLGDSGPSLGDQYVFSSTLTEHGRTVGHTGVVCTLTSVQRNESECVGTAYFRWGQISVQGLVPGDANQFALPITGGTGAFEGAGGTLYVRELSQNPTRELLTFSLS